MLKRRENIKKCYVCHREVNGDCVDLTRGFYRHTYCFIGSPNWFKFKPEGKFNHLFKDEKGEDNDKNTAD